MMKTVLSKAAGYWILASAFLTTAPLRGQTEGPIALVLHGGAGAVSPEALADGGEKAYRDALGTALDAGYAVLEAGGAALDAVEAAIRILEDSPLFNAGKGAVFTSDGETEMDASIMEGAGRRAGAVGGVTVVKNPIAAARAVMEITPHVLLMGAGADAFARESGLEIVSREYFKTERRREQWRKAKGFAPEVRPQEDKPQARLDFPSVDYLGTVGAVALDREGNIAAGTSTGGLTNKRFGRIGDSPIIGAGTFADNRSCGVSCTGHGEYFIRYAVAHDVAARMTYLGESVAQATRTVVQETLVEAGGRGGLIALDAQGAVSAEFNTPSMFRAWIDGEGQRVIAIRKAGDDQ